MSDNNDTLDGGTSGSGTLPSFLNVLTILTFIGRGLAALTYLIGAFAFGTLMSLMGMGGGAMDQMRDSMGDLGDPEMADAFAAMDSASGLLTMGSGAIMAIFLVLSVCAVLCIVGAARMRKLRKSGFTLYVIGNGVLLLAGIWLATQGFGGYLGVIITAAFIGMYAMNRKHLVND